MEEKLPRGAKKKPIEEKKVPLPQFYLMPIDIELLGGRKEAYDMGLKFFEREIKKRK